ncbi:Ribulose-5-phosphate 4-epimerase/Fuculose-1-phosphate aldolase [Ralstonia sp. 25mfcol4.1]|uniref:class II aldolase/adducin family protein n=1 Tax=Ralstonia sp. 25mfcol4.1 TaxID=1761899 RepID=UPI0004164FB6|nr:class II aldolase/adducin family protein [Ralstonia sp. 25mfcol4.1]SDP77563.1 Ribulose-5-phosphate 4-epimerase/Fuculose-1-phosphate aldolase [Ralstonia sp. 25mfcol4.1]
MLKIGDVSYPSLEGKVSEEEWDIRVQTAALYRLVPLMGWDDLSMQLVSARVGDHYLFGPAGPLYEEVTASSLVKINLEGDVISDTPFGIVKSTWHPMRAVHEARKDANFVIHTHDDIIAAVACNSAGLLPISQSAAFAIADGLGYHDYEGAETYAEKIPSLQRSLGPTNNAVLLRNHGLLTLGPIARAAFMRHYNIRKACHIQMMAGGATYGSLVHLSQEMLDSFKFELARLGQGEGTTDPWDGLLRKLAKIDPSFMH